jgi:hypothetical protein
MYIKALNVPQKNKLNSTAVAQYKAQYINDEKQNNIIEVNIAILIGSNFYYI